MEQLSEEVQRYVETNSLRTLLVGDVRFGSDEAARDLDIMRSRPRVAPPGLPAIDLVFDTKATNDVPVRVYVPESPRRDRVLIVYLHGGGWVSGDLDMHDTTCRVLAARCDAVVVNVDYRLAPEHAYPAPLDDATDATEWAIERAAEWGADPRRVIVAGTSSGGNLAAGVAIRRRGASPSLLGQVLIYAPLDGRRETQSYAEKATGWGLTANHMRYFWDAYAQGETDPLDPELSPLLLPEMEGLPQGIVITAEHDPLRDDGDSFADRLDESGLLLLHRRVAGQVHGFLTTLPNSPDTKSAFDEIVQQIVALGEASLPATTA